MSKNALCSLIQIPVALMLDLALSDLFPLISSRDNRCQVGSILTLLVTSSSISAMFSLNSLCLRVTKPPFLHDIACGTLFGYVQPQ